MFDGTEAQLPPCPSSYLMAARQCGDLIELSFGTLSGFTCAYDAQTHALVGARVSTDAPVYCGNTSYGVTAGRFPDASCAMVPFAIMRTCPAPDGGAAD
jgi:hypothetical protein